MTLIKRSLFLSLAFSALFLACDENPGTPDLGSVEITTNAPTIEEGFSTSDGWAVKYTRFLVNVSAVNIAGNDGVLTASATSQVIDYAAPPTPKTLVSNTNRIARAWEDVNLEVGPVTTESAVVAPVTTDDQTMMTTGGFSLYMEATLTKGAVVKTLKAGFTPDTKYTHCASPLNGGVELVPGLVVPANGGDTALVTLTGEVFFFDNLPTRGHVLRADPIASADKDNDNVITVAELQAITLDDARKSTGLYESTNGATDLNAFIAEQSRSLVSAFRAPGGLCTTEPVLAGP